MNETFPDFTIAPFKKNVRDEILKNVTVARTIIESHRHQKYFKKRWNPWKDAIDALGRIEDAIR